MKVTAYELYKEAPLLIIDDQEFETHYVKPDPGNAYKDPVIEFEIRDQTFSPMYLDLNDIIELDDEGKGIIHLKDISDWNDAVRHLTIHAMLTVPFNSVNRAKRAIGAV